MAKAEDGYIKYNVEWEKAPIASSAGWHVLNRYRTILFDEGLVGMDEKGIGFGNVSMRLNGTTHFLISGTQTGHKRQLDLKDYAEVTSFDVSANKVWCRGLTKASSESMTHAAIYAEFDQVNFVFHIHQPGLWRKWKDTMPTTASSIPYGTPQMARAIQQSIGAGGTGPVIMGGHPDGIILFGKSASDAFRQLDKLHQPE